MRFVFLLLVLFLPPAPVPTWAVYGDAMTTGRDIPPQDLWINRVAADWGLVIDNRAQDTARIAKQVAILETSPRHAAVLWAPGVEDLRRATPAEVFQAELARGVAFLEQQGARIVIVQVQAAPGADPALVAAYRAVIAATGYAVDVGDWDYFDTIDGLRPGADNHARLARAVADAARAPFRASLPLVLR